MRAAATRNVTRRTPAKRGSVTTTTPGSAGQALFGAVLVTVLVYFVPMLEVLAWPLMLISTFVHEVGHGLTAMLCGGHFERLLIWPDASGVAEYRGTLGRAARSAIAAGGLLGPPLAAAALFAAAQSAQHARRALAVAAVAIGLIAALWVDGAFGILFCAVLALACLGCAGRGGVWAQFAAVFLAIQLALSVFSRSDYLFAREAMTGSGPMPSDTQQIAAALLLPYFVWGALIALLSVVLLAWGLRRFMRSIG